MRLYDSKKGTHLRSEKGGETPIAINLRRKPGFEQQLPRSWLLLALGLRAEARQPLGQVGQYVGHRFGPVG